MKFTKQNIKDALVKEKPAVKNLIKYAELDYFIGLNYIFARFDFKFDGGLKNSIVCYSMKFNNKHQITNILYVHSTLKILN